MEIRKREIKILITQNIIKQDFLVPKNSPDFI